MDVKQQVQQALKLLESGRRSAARDILRDILTQNRNNPFVWAAMVQVAESKQETIFCLKQVLRLKPGDAWATGRLERLELASDAPASAPSSGGDQEKVSPFTAPSTSATSPFTSEPQVSAEPKSSMPVAPALGASMPTASAPGGFGQLMTEVRGEEQTELVETSEEADKAPDPNQELKRFSTMWVVLLIALILFLGFLGYGVTKEVYTTYFTWDEADEAEVLAVAQQWTGAFYYRADFGAMQSLACERYMTDLLMASFANFIGSARPSGEVPEDLTHELVWIHGKTARVRVVGLFPIDTPEGLQMEQTETFYTMKYENERWTWCGQTGVMESTDFFD